MFINFCAHRVHRLAEALVGALGESETAAVLEHKFCPEFQVFARVDVTDGGRFAFSQSIRQGFGGWF